ncbi:DNA cytosine methyltransferase [Gulosibacter bifidus]|uniref:DNA cytosine methyltransferase n=1 Tax=Gulosibacter bifidus TaxID=272239 RepID=A0ABW5RHM9_9MICO|nr:DNA cytosine methyltransferase [Gulosibacter bifidus]
MWFSELNEPVARVFSRHWPGVPDLADITTINWNDVEPVDILIGGFPCQDVSTVGKRAGLAPGTRSGLWAHMADAIDALQPEWDVIENDRGLLPSPASRPPVERGNREPRNPSDAPPTMQPFANWNPTRGIWEATQLDFYGVTAPFSAIWPSCGWMLDGSAYRLPLSALLTTASASSSSPTARCRTPFATDSSRGDETLDQVRARRGTIALSHQIIDFALHGPHGSPAKRRESETLWSLIDGLYNDGDATPTPSPDENTSPDDQHQPRRSLATPTAPLSTRVRRMAHGPADRMGHRHW